MENGRIGRAMFLVGKISFVLLVFLPAGIAEIVTKPTVTEVVVGGSTFLNCSTNGQLKINWFLTKVGSDAANYIYLDDTFRTGIGRFQMERDETNRAYNLVIQSVKMEDAGLYGCEGEGGQRSKHEAQLIVLDDLPVCQSNTKPHGIIGPNICGIEPEELHVTCAVRYHGNQPPLMQWRESGKVIVEGVTHNASSDRAIYNLKVKVNSQMDGLLYECATTRSTQVQYECTSGVIKVTANRTTGIIVGIVVSIIISFIVGCIVGQILKPRCMKLRGPTENSNQCQEPKQSELIDAQGQTKNSNHKKSPARKNSEQIELIDKQDKLTAENKRLLAKVTELEQQMYADNKARKTSATLAHTIVTQAAEKANGPTNITGMTILDNNLFVVKNNCPVVEVYDPETFVFLRIIDKLHFTNPLDIASSKENKFLYVISRENGESTSQILRFNTAGEGGKIWATENDDGRLSTYESNLIVCFSTKRIIIEYTPEGEAVNIVRLSPGNGFNNLWHVVKLTGTHFMISHSKVDIGQRVCVVDINNNSVVSALEELPRLSQGILRRDYLPICLVGQRDESVLVADARNKRVLLLNPKELGYEAELIKTDTTQTPVRLCLNEAKNRLFVGVVAADTSKFFTSETPKEGSILIYNLTK